MAAVPLVMVPGLLCNARLFAHQLEWLGKERSVLVANNTSHDSIAGIAANILKTAPAKFALAGLSMGGYIAFEIFKQAPGRVDRIALLNTRAEADSPEIAERRHRLVALSRSGRFRAVTSEVLMQVLVHPSRRSEAELVCEIVRMADETGEDAFYRQIGAVLDRSDSRALLPSIACPALILVGEADAITPKECSILMAQSIPHAELVIVPECGHLSPMERPELVSQYLANWLAW